MTAMATEVFPIQLTDDSGTAIARAASGDRHAFEHVYRVHLNHVYSLCVRMTGDRTRAEELTQDVFVRAWEKLPTFRGESAFSTWLHRLTVNVVLDERRVEGRDRGRTVSSDEDDEGVAPAGSTAQPLQRGKAGPRAGDREAATGRAKSVRTARRGGLHARGDRNDARGHGRWMQGAAASGAAALTGGFDAMTYDKHECDLMCERLAAYMEGDLPPAERAEAERHLGECVACADALAELRAIASQAAQLPLLAPSRDLWAGIEARISTPVTRLEAVRTSVRRAPRRQWQFALAAGALIAVSAGTTYMITTHSGATGSQPVTVATATPRRDSQPTVVPAPVPAQQAAPAPISPSNVSLASRKKNVSVTRVYDREIAMLDSVVHTRRESLDPKTIRIIEQNLKIIDNAIAESRAALAKDPKSPLLTNRLDNVLGSKVQLLRTIAFLPTQS
jgi:RNA polymerase sigma factor, sigma-70 family